jgi:hypothetical protein
MTSHLVNAELAKYGLSWDKMKEVKTLRNSNMNPNGKPNNIRVCVIEHHFHYEVRIFDLTNYSEVLFKHFFKNDSWDAYTVKEEYQGAQAENHFLHFRKMVCNNKHIITHYTV